MEFCRSDSVGKTGTHQVFGKKVSRLLFPLRWDDFPIWISVWERVPFSLCVFSSFPKCRLFLLSRRPDHSGFSVRSQTRPHGFPLGLAVLTLPGMPGKDGKGWGNSPIGVEMEVGEGVEGFHVHRSSPRWPELNSVPIRTGPSWWILESQ